MGRSHTLQTNFTAGELSPLLRAREDIQKYFNGAEKLENFIVKPQGGAFRRSGTQMILETKDTDIVGWNSSSAKVRLVEFEFSTTQAYILELGNLYARVYKQSGVVTSTNETISGVTQANPAVVTATGHSLSNGDHVVISGIVGMTELNGRRFEVANKTTNTFELLGEDSTSHTAYSSGGDADLVYEFTTPWATADLDDLYFTQSADVLYVAHPDYEPRKITRTADTSWTVSTFDGEKGPYLSINSGDTSFRLATLLTVSGITQANPAVVTTSSAHGLETGDIVRLYDVGGMTEVNDAGYTITVVSTTTFSLDGIDSTGYTAYTSGGTADVGKVSDTATVTSNNDIFVSGDVGKYIEYSNGNGVWGLGRITEYTSGTEVTIEPQKVYEQPAGTYYYIGYDGGAGGPRLLSPYSNVFDYDDVGRHARANDISSSSTGWWRIDLLKEDDSSSTRAGGVTAITLASGYTIGEDRCTISNRSITATLIASSGTFASTDVGRWVRMQYGIDWVDCKITAYTDSTHVTVSISEDTEIPKDPENNTKLLNDGETVFWRLGAWSDTTGWPSVVSFHQQRLWFASTNDNPDTLWSSKVDDYANFQPTDPDGAVLDDSAITVTIASNQVNAIKWVESGPVLLIGTLSGEYQMRAASTINEPLTPSNVDVKTQTSNGTLASHMPQRVGSAVLFIQRAGREVHDMRYSFEADSFVSRDLNITSEHILRDQTQANRLRYQKNPNSVVWVLTETGDLITLTYEADQDIYAWSRQKIGGTGVVESIASIPSSAGTEDEIWMVVKRTINTKTVRYIEKLLPDFNPASATDKDEMKFVDSMLSGSATSTTVRGLNHLEGESLQVLVDGEYVGDKTVSSGAITLDDTGTTVIAGLQFISKVKSMPLAPRGDWGSSGGSVKRVPKGYIHVLNSLGHRYGASESDLIQDDYREEDDDMDQAPNLFTGWKEFNIYGDDDLDNDLDYEGQVWIQQQQPHPLNILAIVLVVENSE